MSAPRRIQRKRTKGWQMPDGAVYVGRPTKWGNPWKAGEPHGTAIIHLPDPDSDCNFPVEVATGPMTVARVVNIFDDWLRWGIPEMPPNLTREGWCNVQKTFAAQRETLLKRLPELRGRDLACWCPLVDEEGNPVPCHADVLLEIANR